MLRLKSFWQAYVSDLRGAFIIGFAMVIPVVVGMAGLSVDVAAAYMVKKRLSHALDAAALAAAASSSNSADINAAIQQFMKLNYPPQELGAPYSITVKIDGSDITVSGQAKTNTYFARVLGVNQMQVAAQSTVTREIIGLEVAMVLDVTGSMSTNNNISALRTAATNFTNILFNNAAYQDSVKIGLVPFSSSVSVGPYGLGKLPLASDERKAGTANYDTAFVNNGSNLKFDQTSSTQWWGCILERPSPQDTQNAGTNWKWDMYKFNVSGAADKDVRNTSLPAGYGNYGCNKSYILPLTSDKAKILSRVGQFVADGNTLSNVGMVWGYRVLSPEAPFREGVSWTNKEWRKVAILMTDGDNNNGEIYNAYGPYNTLKVTDTMLDQKLLQTCTNMKKDGITIYTVTFTSAINNTTKNYFRNCASSADKYIDAPSQKDLISAFEQISRELSNIHISN